LNQFLSSALNFLEFHIDTLLFCQGNRPWISGMGRRVVQQ
jgi:hypothetical protein